VPERHIRVGKRGEIVIPSDVRRLLGIVPGRRIALEIADGSVVLRPKPGLGTALLGTVKPAPGAPAIEQILAELDASEDLP